MSFGFSPTDILTLVQLTTRTYNGWKTACGKYASITCDLAELQILLTRMEEEAKTPNSLLSRDTNDFRGWRTLYKNCHSLVTELESVINKHKSLGLSGSRQKNWDRIRFGNKNLDNLTEKLAKRKQSLSAFMSILGISSQARMENKVLSELMDKVNDIAARMRNGDGSVSSALTTRTNDDKAVWKEFRREMLSKGVTSDDLQTYSSALMTYVVRLQRKGLLDEEEDGLSAGNIDSGSTQAESEYSSSEEGVQLPKGDDVLKTKPATIQPPSNDDQTTRYPPTTAAPLTYLEQKLFRKYETHTFSGCLDCIPPRLSKPESEAPSSLSHFQLCAENAQCAALIASRVFEYEGTFYRKSRPGCVGVELSIPNIQFTNTKTLIKGLSRDKVVVVCDVTCCNCGAVGDKEVHISDLEEEHGGYKCDDCSPDPAVVAKVFRNRRKGKGLFDSMLYDLVWNMIAD